MTIDDKKAEMRKNFIKCDDVVEALHVAQETGENIILWGLGGYAKSEMVKQYFGMQGMKPFVQVCGAGTTEEKLLGGLNMKLFNDNGKIEYLCDESFMNHEIVVFEEVFDVPIRVLLILKDILTEGMFRNGSQQYKSKVKLVVCCTNRSKNEVIEDNSHKALLERFKLLWHVGWDSHTAQDFVDLFTTVIGRPITDLAKLIGTMHTQGIHISPRTAIGMSTVWEKFGREGLKFVDGVPENLLNLMVIEHEKQVKEEKRNEAFNNFYDALTSASIFNAQKDENDYETLLTNSVLAGFISQELKNVHAQDDEARGKLNKLIANFENEAKSFYKIAFENAQPSKKIVRPIQAIFDEYYKNENAPF